MSDDVRIDRRENPADPLVASVNIHTFWDHPTIDIGRFHCRHDGIDHPNGPNGVCEISLNPFRQGICRSFHPENHLSCFNGPAFRGSAKPHKCLLETLWSSEAVQEKDS